MDGLAFVQMVETELEKRNIPKERFYKESGISSATMSQWRKRIYSPSSAAIKKIEKYLGVTFTIEQKNNAPDELVLTEDEIRILSAFREMSPERQKALADLLGISDPQK